MVSSLFNYLKSWTIGYLLGWFYDVYYGPVYDGGYYYQIDGEWKWFPMRNWELERYGK